MSCFHVSKTGTATPGYPFAREYSAHPTPVTNGVWQFHVGTYDGSAARSYLNGNFTPYTGYTDPLGNTYDKNPYTHTEGLNSVASDFTVGAVQLNPNMGNFFEGDISGLRVWNRALSAAEIANIYAEEVSAI